MANRVEAHPALATPTAARWRWYALALTVILQFANSVPHNSVGALAPYLQQDLGLTRAQIGMLVAAGQIGMALTFIPGGWAADRFTLRAAMALGVSISACSPLLLGQSGGFALALVALGCAGLGLGLSSPAATLAIVRWFSVRQRGTAMGIKQAGTAGGGIIAALALPALAELLGWRNATLVVAAGVLAAAAGVGLSYRDPPEATTTRATGGGLIGPWAFSQPILLATLYAAILVAVQFCITGYTTLYLTEVHGYTIVAAGTFLAVAQAGGTVGRIGWGIVSDVTFGGRRKPVLVIAGALATLGLFALGLSARGTPTVLLGLVYFVVGAAGLGWQGVHIALVVESAGSAHAGRVAGFSLTALQFGPIFGPPLIGSLIDTSGSYALAWTVLASITAVATGVTGAFLPERQRTTS